MDIKLLDKALQEIAKKRNELQKIDYNDPKYDDLEEELHDLEDDFHEEFGDYIEGVLQEIHDKLSPDTDILYPIAYIAKSYVISKANEFSVLPTEGVYIEVDKMPGKDTKLALVPNPVRVVLNIGKDKQEVIWTSK